MSRASVIIPVYNGADYIEAAISSALTQDCDDFDVVVCDNASSDQTVDIARSISDPRLSVLTFDQHVDMPSNFNRAWANTTSEFVRFLCHDDLLSRQCVESTVAALAIHTSASIATSFETTIGARQIRRGAHQVAAGGLHSGEWATRRLLSRGNWIGGPTAVTLRRSAVPSEPFDSRLTCSFDAATWFRLLRHGDIVVVPEPLFHSRIHPRQATNACAEGGFQRDWEAILDTLQADPPPGASRSRIYRSRFMNRMGRM